MDDATHDEWDKDDQRRAFVDGAKFWEYHQENATMWQSDQNICIVAAEKKYADYSNRVVAMQARIDELEAEAAKLEHAKTNPEGIRVFILRFWSREMIVPFCLHLLGDDWQALRENSEKLAELAINSGIIELVRTASRTKKTIEVIEEVERLGRILAPDM